MYEKINSNEKSLILDYAHEGLHRMLLFPLFNSLECPPNELFVECNASCQPECGASFNSSEQLSCGCVHGCVCKPGLIRSSKTKKCISMEKCRQIIIESNVTGLCGKNEHYSESEAGCQPSCYFFQFAKPCALSAGCKCNDGFVRDVGNGECIPFSKCPSNCINYN